MILEVSSGNQKPYYIKSLGPEKGVYIRTGRSSVLATPEMKAELLWESVGRSIDARPEYHANEEAVSEKLFKDFLTRRRQKGSVEEFMSLMKGYNILVPDQGRLLPTVGGILLFRKNPQEFYSEAFIIATEYEGIKGRKVRATKDCTGTLFQQYSSAYDFILSKLEYSFQIKGRQRGEVCEIPEIAVREVLVNAIVHRSYSQPAPTKVSVYQDRVEIVSPGGFPGPLLKGNLRKGLTFIRNKVISRAFREVGLIEKLGSGLITLFEEYENAGLPPPEVEDGGLFVKCVLPRKESKSKQSSSSVTEEPIKTMNFSDLLAKTLNLQQKILFLP